MEKQRQYADKKDEALPAWIDAHGLNLTLVVEPSSLFFWSAAALTGQVKMLL